MSAALAAKDSTALAVLGFFIEVSMTFIISRGKHKHQWLGCVDMHMYFYYIYIFVLFNQQGTSDVNKTKSWDILTSYLKNISKSGKQIACKRLESAVL